jgi:chemotaxis protein MotA
MEKGSLIGLVLVLFGVFVGLILKGADPVALFTNVAALLIVLVGSIGAVMLSYTWEENMMAMKAAMKVFKPSARPDPGTVVERMAEFATQARTQGILALEQAARDEKDPFLRKALLMASDGMDAHKLERQLQIEMAATRQRHKTAAGWWTQVGIFCPTYGIIGAVVGLIAVLGSLDDPAKLGHGIGAAFVATFWGVFLANGLYLPFANKLTRLSAAEHAVRIMQLDGIVAIMAGATPRTITEQLQGHLAPALREAA